ncbi:Uncharacterized conserved protein, Ntn-hydrolase superfamily [Aureimonas altamirensis DSM 21988]|uniref:Major pilin protein fimA n=2 Tax=Aureimonas altamirensis TaxID=370622 RepID=A0A0N7KX84_9HYPH|nr:DUF1028 domain-containing protein [Aureimonas altamirensis]BAT26209.1 hypothetical protein [Aureimonas altamirensis]SHJ40904.1 Uncharacterized conserved protein, Ntn-hydrolase superfamily [Aureimonas altamirensis DSM 21988]
MTLSIAARCPRTNQFGVAAATEMPAVGKFLSYAYPGFGAFATQALVNPYLGIDGVKLLSLSVSAHGTVETVLDDDAERHKRQVAAIDKEGRAYAFTGEDCLPWAGHRTDRNVSVQGNRLEGPSVLEAMLQAFEQDAGAELVHRLIAAIAAGVAAGGDRAGERSANVYIVGAEEYPLWDIRVDDHPDVVSELRRLETVFRKELYPHVLEMPPRRRG